MKTFLDFAGKNGALIVIAGVLIGILAPPLAGTARPFLTLAIFVFTFGSFLKVGGSSSLIESAGFRRNLLMVLWATFGVPVVIFVAIVVFKPGSDLAEGLLFWSLVPTSPACVAFAAMLNLNTAVALLATIFGTALAPFLLPALASALGGYHVQINPYATSFELTVLVGGAFVASLIAKRFLGRFIKENPEAMTGVAVTALFIAGLGSMRGMQDHLLRQPGLSLEFVALAYAVLFGFELLGSLLFWPFGKTNAFTAGLISGTRTITLAWVVLGDKILPLADLFLATSMIAKYTAPGFTKFVLSRFIFDKMPAPAIMSQNSLLEDPVINGVAPSEMP